MLDFHFLKKDFKNRKISLRHKEDIEPQEIFLDDLAQKQEEKTGISEKRMETPLSRRMLQGFCVFSLILILGLFLKTFQFQVLEAEKFSTLAEENKTRIYPIRSERGVIYDSKGEQLVRNQVSFDLICDKQDLPQTTEERKELFYEVAKLIGEETDFIEEKIENSELAKVLIFKNLNHKALISFEIKIQNQEFSGFRIEKNIIRDYKDGAIFAHLIGYTGNINKQELEDFQNYSVNDYIGKTGLEKFYEKTLRGKSGEFLIEKDAFGNQKIEKIVSLPEPGDNLVLCLDAGLQRKIKESLEKTLQNVGAEKAIAVALNPNNGGVLAMVSIPDFDNNLFSQGISQEDYKEIIDNPLDPLFNKAISGIGYPTGSTIKPLIGTAALEEGVITDKTNFICKGKISVQDQWNPEIWKDFNDWKTHGRVDIYKAIAESCNVFFYIIGGGYEDFKGLGPTKIKKWLGNFGWGSKTGIDLPQEGEGIVPDPVWKKENLNEAWYDGDTYYLSIGQQYISVTPLQVVNAFSAVANGGVLYQPHIVQTKEPKVLSQGFVAQENLKIIRQGMRETVAYGSAVNWLNSLPVKSAAKTGTAQTAKKGYYHSWITVFAPIENPEIVLTVMVEDVEEGQVATLPVAKDVLEWYFSENLDKDE
ncbi:penicillin-binding protein 2 [Candidatus Parcubacteria bacterium]|nr:penicillin-binding protein 2 [Candidatus Parcubacteria bacterium]